MNYLNPYISSQLQANIPHINIENATAADCESIALIYNQAIDLGYVTADTEHVTAESRLTLLNHITQTQNRPFWVAKTNNQIIGFFYFRNFYDRPAYRITAEIGIYIHTNFAGMGIGQSILNFCLEKAPALGIENILALVFAQNKASIGLFEKNGFTLNGTFNHLAKTTHGYHDLHILMKQLV